MVKFLVIRFSSIGDIVLTTHVIRGLKQQVEDAEVHYLTKPGFSNILEANPYIDKIHILDGYYDALIRQLKEENFDYIIDLQNNLRSLRIKRVLKKMFFSVDKLNVKKWLLVNFRINRLPELHIVDRYLQTVHLFDVKDDGNGLDYFIPEQDEVDITAFPSPFKTGYLVLVIGAKHNTKKLPLSKIIELAEKIEDPIIIVGGPEDKNDAEQVCAALPGKNVMVGAGKWSVHQSASVIRQSRGVITHDTGMMHIAAAFRKKILSIWGNTIPEFGMYPYRPDPDSKIFEVEGLSCRPCSKIGKQQCPKKHFRCMMDQDMDAIALEAGKF